MTTEGVVKKRSAFITWRDTTAMACRLPLRLTIHMKNAVPIPVPKRMVDDTMCSVFKARYITTSRGLVLQPRK